MQRSTSRKKLRAERRSAARQSAARGGRRDSAGRPFGQSRIIKARLNVGGPCPLAACAWPLPLCRCFCLTSQSMMAPSLKRQRVLTCSANRSSCAFQLNPVDMCTFLKEKAWPVVGHMEGTRERHHAPCAHLCAFSKTFAVLLEDPLAGWLAVVTTPGVRFLRHETPRSPPVGALGARLRSWMEASIWKLEKMAAVQDEAVPTFEETVGRLQDLLVAATEANNVVEKLRRVAHVAAWVTQGVVTADDLVDIAAYEVRLRPANGVEQQARALAGGLLVPRSTPRDRFY